MRKIIIIILFSIEAFIVFANLFQAEKSTRYSDFINAENTIDSHKVILSANPSDADGIYEAFSRLSEQYGANIIASRLKQGEDGRAIYTKYIYITYSGFYDKFVYEGTPVDLPNDSNQFFSTEATGESGQIGRIVGFGGEEILEIRTLHEFLNGERSVDGTYTIQMNSGDFAAFCDAFHEQTNRYLQEAPLFPSGEDGSENIMMLWAAIACIHLVMMLVVVYDFAKDSKSIAVEKMMGYRERSIWGRRILRLLRNQILAFAVVFMAMSFMYFKILNAFTIAFLQQLLIVGVVVITFTLVLSIVTFVTIAKVSVVGMLKNLRPLRFINILNITAKISLMCLLIFLGQSAMDQYTLVSGLYVKNFANWEKARDLYRITYLTNADYEELSSEETDAKFESLYIPLNRNGAILGDFSSFTPKFQEANVNNTMITDGDQTFKNYFLAIVNPNYLQEFPIYDSDGNAVQVAEGVEDQVLLVPESMRAEEDQLRKYCEIIRHSKGEGTTLVGSDVEIINQKTNIIWIKNDQKHFTFDLSINPAEGSTISNIVLNVQTEKNAVHYYYTGMGILIKPLSTDPKAEIREILKSHGVDKYVDDGAIMSAYDSVAQEADASLQMMSLALFAIGVLFLTLIMIIVQSIYNYFDKHKRLISIKTFMGHSFWQKYGPYFLGHVAVAWTVILVITIIVNLSQLLNTLPLVLILMGAEILISLGTVFVIRKKKILDTLKGGH